MKKFFSKFFSILAKLFSILKFNDYLIIFGLLILAWGLAQISPILAAIVVGGLMLAGGVFGSIRAGIPSPEPEGGE